MAEYKNILIGYRNESQKYPGQFYFKIKNVSGKDFIVKDEESFFINETPQARLEKYPNIPHISKSIKLDDDGADPHQAPTSF